MVRRCSEKLAKLLLVIFNALFFVCGVVLLVIGGMDFKRIGSVNSILTGVNGLNGAVIVVGAIVCVVSFLGCCGSYKESLCMLNAFLGCLVIILIAESVMGYLAFDNSAKLTTVFKQEAKNSLSHVNDSQLLKDAWDDVQLTMHCCGSDSYKDYYQFKLPIPPSCCKKAQEHCDGSPDAINKEGCFLKMMNLIEVNSFGIGTAIVVIAFLEVIGVIFACCLRSAFNERYETV